ncbi:MAG: DUF58 domain-containing protein [Rubricoccaceae bacterium]
MTDIASYRPPGAPARPSDRPRDRRRQAAHRQRVRKARTPAKKTRIPLGFLRNLYLTSRPFWILAGLVIGFIVAYFWEPLFFLFVGGVVGLALALVADVLLLWTTRGGGLKGAREVPDKLSLGDPNPIQLSVTNGYPFTSRVAVLDEVPVQFQKRDAATEIRVEGRSEAQMTYTLRPTERGSYAFGHLNLFASSPLGLVLRRFRESTPQDAKVYPSILQMQRFAFLATSNRLEEVGVKRVRRLGQTMEFDQIRAYVPGDDRRTVNWKATARRGGVGAGVELMVNQYQEERAQPVVAALDMGRTMRSPFEGLTLLDHAINTSLVLLNTALIKTDKAGLVTFDQQVRTVLRPSRRPGTLPAILEALYRQEPGFRDPDYEGLYRTLRGDLRQRSLVLLFTNFDTVAGLERQLPALRQIAKLHRLVVVLFENTGIRELLAARSERLEDVYAKTVAEGLAMEKREIARTLERWGIGALLTRPESLTVDAVNRYLQLKARGAF